MIENNNHLIEGYDKAVFLRWLQAESYISQLADDDVNGICQKWINHKIKVDRAFLRGRYFKGRKNAS